MTLPDRRLPALLALFLIAGGAFTVLAVGVDHHPIPGADARILHDVIDHRGATLTSIGKLVTSLGTAPVIYPVVVVAGVLAWRKVGSWAPMEIALATLISAQVVRNAINHLMARPRPPKSLWLVHPSGYSFPSGHTTNATIGYALIAALLVLAGALGWKSALAGAGVVAIAVGASRIYLGVHWPTDVLGGWLLGVAWLSLIAAIVLAYRQFRPPSRRTSNVKSGQITVHTE